MQSQLIFSCCSAFLLFFSTWFHGRVERYLSIVSYYERGFWDETTADQDFLSVRLFLSFSLSKALTDWWRRRGLFSLPPHLSPKSTSVPGPSIREAWIPRITQESARLRRFHLLLCSQLWGRAPSQSVPDLRLDQPLSKSVGRHADL